MSFKLSQEFTTVTPLSKTIAMILFVFLPILGFYFGMNYEERILLQNQSLKNSLPVNQTVTPTVYASKCTKSNFSSKEEFLTKYTVKQGDTLLSISKSQLKNVSRVNEIIELNKDRYPNLSINTPFLEQGWILFLPPSFTTSTNGKLYEINGEITEVRSDGTWAIIGQYSTEKRPDKDTKFPEKKDFKVGDCVKVMFEGDTQRVLSVSPQ